MLGHDSEPDPSWDQKTAEQALVLAARLQHERGNRVSLQELQRTAEEAGIDPAYLQTALTKVSQEPSTPTRSGYSEGWLALSIMAGTFTFAAIIVDTAPSHANAPLLPAMLTLLAVILIGVVIWTRSKRVRPS